MAKGQYVGVNGVARKVKQPYIGINNVARKVKTAYIGVNNVARECFSGGETWLLHESYDSKQMEAWIDEYGEYDGVYKYLGVTINFTCPSGVEVFDSTLSDGDGDYCICYDFNELRFHHDDEEGNGIEYSTLTLEEIIGVNWDGVGYVGDWDTSPAFYDSSHRTIILNEKPTDEQLFILNLIGTRID